jgi:hypothetical protein
MADPYRTYLRAELEKLRHEGDAREFLDRGACDLDRLGLPSTVSALNRFFAGQTEVDEFVERLSDGDSIYLTDCCDRWRGNGVAGKLHGAGDSVLLSTPIDRILVREAEKDVKHIFERHGYRLPAVAADPDLLALEPYSDHVKGDRVVDLPCLAQHEPGPGGYLRLIDGVHRAIQLVRNDEQTISLLVI